MEPLPARLRPISLDEFVGQTHLVGDGAPLSQAMKEKQRFSFVLWGPPGVGKTTLARLYAQSIDSKFYELSAVSAGKADIRKIVDERVARHTEKREGGNENVDNAPAVLFLDEIHRFNKAQQDFLLPFVEDGTLLLIGATTENPSFEMTRALLSRMRVFVLQPFSDEEMERIIDRANVILQPDARTFLITYAQGDARRALSILESAHSYAKKNNEQGVTQKTIVHSAGSAHVAYDKSGEEHYNLISAFIKSMRASKPDESLYYLARMLEGGEDPKFIARRMVIFASEDIGLAQPTALVLANEVFRAVETVGLPECAINLAHGVAYLARAKKDRSAYQALRKAERDVKAKGNLMIPLILRNAPTKLLKELEYGKSYEMYPEKGSYFPEALKDTKYF